MKSFEAFWPHYLGEHLHPINRALHFTGTTLVYLILLAGIVDSWHWTALAPLVGYGFAWGGHFFVERNRPATFTHPLWSLRGDFRMHWRMASGTLRADLERVAQLRAASLRLGGPG